MNTPLDPNDTICIIKHDDREIGRIAAADPNATAYIAALAMNYGSLTVDYKEDKDAAIISRMLAPQGYVQP